MICVEKQEEKKQPGPGEVFAAVAGLSWGWWSTVELLVVDGGAAGDPLQLLEKAEKQRWMLIASVAFGWWHDQKIDVFSQVQECRSNK